MTTGTGRTAGAGGAAASAPRRSTSPRTSPSVSTARHAATTEPTMQQRERRAETTLMTSAAASGASPESAERSRATDKAEEGDSSAQRPAACASRAGVSASTLKMRTTPALSAARPTCDTLLPSAASGKTGAGTEAASNLGSGDANNAPRASRTRCTSSKPLGDAGDSSEPGSDDDGRPVGDSAGERDASSRSCAAIGGSSNACRGGGATRNTSPAPAMRSTRENGPRTDASAATSSYASSPLLRPLRPATTMPPSTTTLPAPTASALRDDSTSRTTGISGGSAGVRREIPCATRIDEGGSDAGGRGVPSSSSEDAPAGKSVMR